MSGSGNYKIVSIEVETIFGQDPDMDRLFTDYLEEYSISHKVVESESPSVSGWPRIQYTGGPISLSNMLQEKFGYSLNEISTEFPEINEAID